MPTVSCDSAPLVCLTDYCATTLNEPAVCCMNFCGQNTIINNPQYFRFIATGDTVEIDIHVNACNTGQGLQSAIVTSCNWAPCPGGMVPCPEILTCNPGTSPGEIMILKASGLVYGQSYWLLIDGSNGSTCEYKIDYAAGVFEPPLIGELDSLMTFANSNVVAQGYQGLQVVTGPAVGNAHGYYWTFGWNSDTLTTTLPELNINIAANAPPGIWNICVHAFSGCDTTENEICTQIEITGTTGISNVQFESGISIFPNPTRDQLQINLPQNISLPVKWVLFDQLGINHLNGSISNRSTNLHLENTYTGVYFLEMKYGNGNTGIYKVIIE